MSSQEQKDQQKIEEEQKQQTETSEQQKPESKMEEEPKKDEQPEQSQQSQSQQQENQEQQDKDETENKQDDQQQENKDEDKIQEEVQEQKQQEKKEPVVQQEQQNQDQDQQQQQVAIPENQAQKLFLVGSAECDQFYIDDEDDNGDPITECKKPYLITYFSDRNILIHKIICGGLHTVALTTHGDIYTWGCNDSGALGRLTNETEEQDKENPDNMCSKPERVPFPGNYKFDMISAGDSHSCCANSEHGILYQWGNFRDGRGEMFETKKLPVRMGEKELNKKKITKIVSGSNHFFILASGVLFAAGDPDTCVLGRKPGQRHRSTVDIRIESIQKQVDDVWTGGYHGFLKKTRSLKNPETKVMEKTSLYYAWGLNKNGQLGIDSDEDMKIFQTEITAFRGKDIVNIVGGEHHSLALDKEGFIYSWGKNDDGQCGLGETLEDLVKSTVYTQEEVDAFQDSEKRQRNSEIRRPIRQQVFNKEEDEQQIKQIYAGTHSCGALSTDEDSQLYTWGLGENYVLFTRGDSNRYKPFNIPQRSFNEELVQQIALSGQHSCFITSESENAPAMDMEKIKNGIPADFYAKPETKLAKSKIAVVEQKNEDEDQNEQKEAKKEKKTAARSKSAAASKKKEPEQPKNKKQNNTTKKAPATTKKGKQQEPSKNDTKSKKQTNNNNKKKVVEEEKPKKGVSSKRKGKSSLDMSDLDKSLKGIKKEKK